MAKTDKNMLFDESEDDSDGGAKLQINDEYAKRFEHNKKREELHRLEEKFKAQKDKDEDSDSSSDETEDENGFLATEELDAQISATLHAIKKKDPRLYDGKFTFFDPISEDADGNGASSEPKEKKEKPVTLHDYQRSRILAGDTGADFDEAEAQPPATYNQEQAQTKQSFLNEIQAQMHESDASDNDDFMKAKKKDKKGKEVEATNGVHPSRAGIVKASKPSDEDADKDPELFLSNFMSSRAWVEEDGPQWKPFESDDEEGDDKDDEWEAAYNLRFEDPSKSNEVLKSYARDVAAARSVRRDDKTARQKKRDRERETKEAEKQERREERARLRRLKIDEAEGKLKKIKHAAGMSGKTLKEEDWQKFLEDAWEDDKWEEEMQKVFNDQYYAEADQEGSEEDEDVDGGKKSKKVKKPKWDDDIDINDLVPDFNEDERPDVSLTDDEQQGEDEEEEDGPATKRRKTTLDRKKERLASQKDARRERSKIEALVDAHMAIEDPEILAAGGSTSTKTKKRNQAASGMGFTYRETRPESFGLTTRDILMASDADLNTFAGLKKLAHFRPDDKQAKDRKKLGKKARLRQWRRETFGDEFEHDPPAFNPGGRDAGGDGDVQENGDGNIIEGGSKKKRKRSKGKGAKGVAA